MSLEAEYQIPCIMHTRESLFGIIGVLSWLTWDIVTSLGDEIEYLWRHDVKWRMKCQYVFVRYAPVIYEGIASLRFRSMNHTVTSCRTWSAINLTFIEILTMTVEIVLVLRVSAIYHVHDMLRKFVFGIFVLEVVVMIVLLPFIIPLQNYSDQCAYIYSPRVFIGYWLSSLLFETFLFGLTLAKFLEHGLDDLKAFGKSALMYKLMRDGTWAFALIFVSMLFGTLMSQLSTTPQSGIGYDVVLGVLSFSGSHVILNTRRLAESEEDEGELFTRSRLVFARKALSESETDTGLGDSGRPINA